MSHEITIQPYRIIPCDLGHPLDKYILKDIVEYLDAASDCRIISRADSIRSNVVLSSSLEASDESTGLYFHLYSDGIGIVSYLDKSEIYAVEDYAPKITLALRGKCHDALLTHTHPISGRLDHHLVRLRGMFYKNRRRLTADSAWEHGGLSYVMSFYFIMADRNLIADDVFLEKMAFLLFPFYSEAGFGESPDVDIEDDFVKNKFRDHFLKVVQEDHDILREVHTSASWSNFLVMGNISDKVKVEYWRLERDLQHDWFYAYITDKFIEHSLRRITSNTPEKELAVVDNCLTSMMFNINLYQGISGSTMHEREFKLYQALSASSRLDMLVEAVENKSKILKDR